MRIIGESVAHKLSKSLGQEKVDMDTANLDIFLETMSTRDAGSGKKRQKGAGDSERQSPNGMYLESRNMVEMLPQTLADLFL